MAQTISSAELTPSRTAEAGPRGGPGSTRESAREGGGGPPILASGRAIGEGVVVGVARFVGSPGELQALRPGEILMVDRLSSELSPALGVAAAVITNEDDPSSKAAAEALGVLAVVGTVNGASRCWSGGALVVRGERGGIGVVYERAGTA